MKKSKNFLKAGILTIVLILTAFSNLALADSEISNAEEAADYIMDVIPTNFDDILLYVWGPVSEGEEIFSTEEHIMDASEDGYVFYLDLYPMANLFHPVQYIFLSESTKEITIKDAIGPPLNYVDYQLIETEMGKIFSSAQNRRSPILEKELPNSRSEKSDSRWAVLMNGGHSMGSNHVRYWNDLSNIYITLVEVYNYLDENIIVLCSDGLDPSPDQSNGQNSHPDLDGDGDDDIMYSCVLSNVDMVFEELAGILSDRNELFIFATDHGSSMGGWDTLFNLWNGEELIDAHFAELLDALPDCEIVCTFEPCYSGGFLDDVVVPPGPRVASSACRYDQLSWAMANLEYDEYVFYWTAAVKGEDAYGEPADADYNEDGFITMDEAYIYAVEHDTRSEDPQYDDYPEGIGAEITLWQGSEPPEPPSKPEGPDEWILYVDTTFSSTTTDPEGESIFYKFDWGDGTDSGWIGPYGSGQTGQASHNWTVLGNYEIKVVAKDIHDVKSNMSEPTILSIVENEPPNAPIIQGPNVARVKRLLKFTLTASDKEGHDLFFSIAWGDGKVTNWDGPYPANGEAIFSHAYNEPGDYTIAARAMDQYEAKGQQTSFKLRVTISRANENILSLRFLDYIKEHFPNVVVLLRFLMAI